MSERASYPINPDEAERKEGASPYEVTISKGETEAKISPEKGAHVTAFSVGGRDILHIDQKAFDDLSNIKPKIGIPLLIPQAGPHEEMRQHGYGRLLPWKWEDKTENSTTVSLESANIKDEEIVNELAEHYNHPFAYEIKTVVEENSLRYELSIKNEGNESMPVAPGLHPYFKIDHTMQGDMTSNLEGFDLTDRDWEKDGSMHFERPEGEDVWITIPEIGKITMKMDPEFKTIVVWSLPGKDFICVEPWTREARAIEDKNERIDIEPGEVKKFNVEFQVELDK